jgi:mono/diheme cytochrome c family protein
VALRGTRAAIALKRTAAALAAVAAIGVAAVLVVSEWRLRREFDIPLVPLTASAAAIASAAPDLVEGERLSRIIGCWSGCHGPEGQGGEEQLDGVFRITAPTLSQVLPAYSNEELVRLIRHGVKRDGRTALGMPAYTFWPLGDAELAILIAHLRAQPPLPPVPRERDITIVGRVALATGRWRTSAEGVDRSSPRWGELPRDTPYERGRYLASVTCTECHGLDYRGDQTYGSPSLAILASYDREQFRHLLRTGEPFDGRELGLMGRVARAGFRHFSNAEIDDLYAFLREFHGLPGGISPDGSRTSENPDN